MGIRARLREVRPGDLARLGDRDQAYDLLGYGGPGTLNLEKSWDGLHRLLTEADTAPELGFLLAGGREVGVRLSYGRPRLLDAGFVRRLDAALRGVSDDRFWAGFDAQRFEPDGVYPVIWDEPAEELRDEYVGYLAAVRDLVGRAAATGGEIIVAIV